VSYEEEDGGGEMKVMTITYLIGIIAVGITSYHLGYWDGWDKGIQHWHKNTPTNKE